MNIYEEIFNKTEVMPLKINEQELNLLLYDFKQILIKQNIFSDYENLDNNLCLITLYSLLYKNSRKSIKSINENITNKIRKNALISLFLRLSSNLLLEKDFKRTNNLLKSFVKTKLIKDAKIIDNKYIELTLLDNTKITYTNIDLDISLVNQYRENCHNIVSYYVNLFDEDLDAVVALEDNELYGKYYHSFVIKKGIVYDFSHNLVINYKSYLKLFNPEILVYEKISEIKRNIDNLKSDKSFADSDYIDVLKYGIYKQKNLKN